MPRTALGPGAQCWTKLEKVLTLKPHGPVEGDTLWISNLNKDTYYKNKPDCNPDGNLKRKSKGQEELVMGDWTQTERGELMKVLLGLMQSRDLRNELEWAQPGGRVRACQTVRSGSLSALSSHRGIDSPRVPVTFTCRWLLAPQM